jgi:fructose-specific phosphotransferase system IIC component
MPLLEAVALFIGELAGYIAGLVVGRTFDLPPKKAQAIGEYLILGVIATAVVAVTIIYS